MVDLLSGSPTPDRSAMSQAPNVDDTTVEC